MSELIQNNKRAVILDHPVDLLDIKKAVNFAEECIKAAHTCHVVTINPEMIMQAIKIPELSHAVKNSELVIPDGIGIIQTLKFLNIKNVERLPGIEFSQCLIERCVEKGYTLGFFGASKEVIKCITERFSKKYPSIKIVFSHDGYFNDEENIKIIEELKTVKPQVIFVALGVPKQELWINKYKKILNPAIIVGVGGSFDVWAGRTKRAPEIYRKLGLEWLFRLITQPSRFNRMFPTLPLFFIKVMLDKKTTRKEY